MRVKSKGINAITGKVTLEYYTEEEESLEISKESVAAEKAAKKKLIDDWIKIMSESDKEMTRAEENEINHLIEYHNGLDVTDDEIEKLNIKKEKRAGKPDV